MRVVIAGGSGALGRRVANDFAERDFDVVILTRSPRAAIAHRQVEWDGRTAKDWATELEDALVVNLAGELVDRRPSAKNVALLTSSRVEPTRALVDAASRLERPPRLWLQMSTLAIYGDAGDAVVDEEHARATGPPQMAGVARAWEQAVDGAATQRLAVLRTGVVLDRGTPAFDRLAHLTKFGLGGRIAAGAQWVSWIHIDDFLRVVRTVVDNELLAGVLHATAPNPVRNADMMATLRSAFHRPWSPPTPSPLVHAGAWLMRTDPALALTGRRCVPRRLLEHGFEFEYERFDAAIASLLERGVA